MPRACTACSHPDRRAIDADIVAGVPNRRIALARGLTDVSVGRHGASHLPVTLTKAAEAAELAHADHLLAKVRGYIVEAEGIMREARTEGDRREALQALDRALASVTLAAKLAGQLTEGGTMALIIASPDWVALRTTIVSALQPFPDALGAVRDALAGHPGADGGTMTP